MNKLRGKHTIPPKFLFFVVHTVRTCGHSRLLLFCLMQYELCWYHKNVAYPLLCWYHKYVAYLLLNWYHKNVAYPLLSWYHTYVACLLFFSASVFRSCRLIWSPLLVRLFRHGTSLRMYSSSNPPAILDIGILYT